MDRNHLRTLAGNKLITLGRRLVDKRGLPRGALLARDAEKIEVWNGVVVFYADLSDEEVVQLRAEGWDAVRDRGVIKVYPRP